MVHDRWHCFPPVFCCCEQSTTKQDVVLAAAGSEAVPGSAPVSLARAATNFDDIDEEDKAGRKTRLFKRHETQGYLDLESLEAASVDKVHVAVTLR